MKTAVEYAPSLDGIPVPDSVRALPVCPTRRIPVPWFVPWVNGKAEFRAADAGKRRLALSAKLCWVCGARVRDRMAFVLGPMCVVTRTTAEPACHVECAVFSVRACPFLSRPHMARRRADDLPTVAPPGLFIDRNPGAACVWSTTEYEPFGDGRGGTLIRVGDPIRDMVSWWAEGRKATRAEVEESVRTGLPVLLAAAEEDGPAAVAELGRLVDVARRWFPAEEG